MADQVSDRESAASIGAARRLDAGHVLRNRLRAIPKGSAIACPDIHGRVPVGQMGNDARQITAVSAARMSSFLTTIEVGFPIQAGQLLGARCRIGIEQVALPTFPEPPVHVLR